MGEYAVSKTTGKQVLHFAYPIREAGELKGFVLASVNLDWFADKRVGEYVGDRGVQVMGVDGSGRLLFSYPPMNEKIGQDIVTTETAEAMVNNEIKYKIMRGLDGVYRVYSYKVARAGEPMLFLVGVSLAGFAPLIYAFVGFLMLVAGGSWLYIAWVIRAGETRAKKRK